MHLDSNADRPQNQRGVPAIPVHLRVQRTWRKIVSRLNRQAFAGAAPAFDGRMLALSIMVLVLAGAAAPFDEAALRWARASNEPLVRFLAAYTDIGKSTFYLVSALAIMTVISLGDWRRRHVSGKARLALVYSQAFYVLASIAFSGILANVVKFFAARARPKFVDILGPYDFFSRWGIGYDFTSFPSGHATTFGALAAILVLWYPRLRPFTFSACLAGAFSRIAAGAHYPSDVIAGFGLGFLFSIFLSRVLARRNTVFRLAGPALLPKLQFQGAFSRN